MDVQRRNLRQIEQLNQRVGRTLSIVDLIQAGTLSVEMAAYAMQALPNGASLLTGARPGGAGKSTLLGLLPPEVPLVTVDRSQVIREGLKKPADEPACYLAHEIGSGHWYGYIWGQDVADFLRLIDGRRRIASCLHADTLDELTARLLRTPTTGQPGAIGASETDPVHQRRSRRSATGGGLLGGGWQRQAPGNRPLERGSRHVRGRWRAAQALRDGSVRGLHPGIGGCGRCGDGGGYESGGEVL